MERFHILQAIKKVLEVDRIEEGEKTSLLCYDTLDFLETVNVLEERFKTTYTGDFFKFNVSFFKTFKEVIDHLMDEKLWIA